MKNGPVHDKSHQVRRVWLEILSQHRLICRHNEIYLCVVSVSDVEMLKMDICHTNGNLSNYDRVGSSIERDVQLAFTTCRSDHSRPTFMIMNSLEQNIRWAYSYDPSRLCKNVLWGEGSGTYWKLKRSS